MTISEILYRKVTLDNGIIQFVPVIEETKHLLAVPWVGQNTVLPNDDYTKSDCGAASLTSWLHYRGQMVSVDEVSRATGKPPNYTYLVFADLDRAANQYGLDLVHQFGTLLPDLLRHEIDAGRPVIVLVYYQALPVKLDPTYKYSHWILIVGYEPGSFFYHDAYWPTAAQGANIPISEAQLMEALRQVNLNGNKSFQGATQK